MIDNLDGSSLTFLTASVATGAILDDTEISVARLRHDDVNLLSLLYRGD